MSKATSAYIRPICVLCLGVVAGCGGEAEPEQHPVTLTVEGPGVVHVQPDNIDCASQCTVVRLDDARLLLTAVPARGARLAAWSAPCSADSAVCEVSAEVPNAIAATFEPTCPNPWKIDGDDVGAMSAHPAGWLVTSGRSLRVHDIPGCSTLWSAPGGAGAVTFDEHGNVFIAQAQRVTLLAGPNGVPLWSHDVAAQVHAVAVGPENRLLAAGERGGRGWLRAFAVLDGHTVWQLRLGTGTLRAVATDDDTVWVVGSVDGGAVLVGYDTLTGAVRWQGAIDAPEATAVSVLPDGTVAVLASAEIHFYDPDTGTQTAVVPTDATMLTGPVAVGSTLVHLPTGAALGTFQPAPTGAVAGTGFVYVATQQDIVRISLP